MKEFIHKPRDKTILLFVLFSLITIIGMSIGYSALNEELSISGSAYVRVEEDIRVTDIKLVEATNGAYETYNTQYSKDTTSMFVMLPNENSSISYEVQITNNASFNYLIKEIIEENYSNPNIDYEIVDLDSSKLINAHSTITLHLKIFNKENINNQVGTFIMKYLFTAPEVLVNFEPNGGEVDVLSKTVIYGNNYGDLPIPVYEGYIFEGWFTQLSGGTKVDENSIVVDLGNPTLYAHWKRDGFSLISKGKTDVTFELFNYNNNLGMITYYSDYIYFKAGDMSIYSNYHTKNKMDLSNYSTLNFYGVINKSNDVSGHLYISSNTNTTSVKTCHATSITSCDGLVSSIELEPTLKVYSIDISNISGQYYVGVLGSNGYISIYDMWLGK